MIVSPAKTAEPIEMPFEMWTCGSLRSHVIGGGSDFSTGRGTLGKGVITGQTSAMGILILARGRYF